MYNIFAVCPSNHFNKLYSGLSFNKNKKNFAFLSHNSKDFKKSREKDHTYLIHTIGELMKLIN